MTSSGGVHREMLTALNEMGAVLVQAHGTSVYSAEALQEVDRIQLQLAEDLQKQFFMLRQPEEEAE